MCELCRATPEERTLLVRDSLRIGNSLVSQSVQDASETATEFCNTLYGENTLKSTLCYLLCCRGYDGEKDVELSQSDIDMLWEWGITMLRSNIIVGAIFRNLQRGHDE